MDPTVRTVGESINRWMNVAFWGMVAIGLLPLVRFTYLPSSDGPAHVYNAKLLLDYFVNHGRLESEYFRPNPVLVPNWLGHLVMAAAMTVVQPAIAEKILWATCVVLLPISFRYALRAGAGRSAGFECLVFPFVYNVHLYWGFYNFCLSLSLYLLSLGYWISRSREFTKRAGLGLSVLSVMAYLGSPVAFIGIGLSVGFLAVCEFLDERTDRREAWKRLAWTVSALVLPTLLFFWYLFGRSHAGRDPATWPSFRYAASTLLTLAPVSAFMGRERIVSIALAIFIGLLSAAAAKQRGGRLTLSEWKYPLLAVGLAALVFLAPASASGGTLLTPRLVYFPVFVIAIWIASRLDSNLWRLSAAFVGSTLALTLLIIRLPIEASYDRTVAALVSIEPSLESGKTLLFITYSDPFPHNLDPSTRRPNLSGHAGGYLAADRHLLLLNNYEAHMDHFPFVFAANHDPYDTLVRQRPNVSCRDLADYARSGSHVDYIVEWNGHGSEDLSLCGYAPATPRGSVDSVSLYQLAEPQP